MPMVDEYWSKVKESSELARQERLKKEALQRLRFNRAFLEMDNRIKAPTRKRMKEKYEARKRGDLVLCLRCSKDLPLPAYTLKKNGRAHDRCRACESQVEEKLKKARNPKRECRSKHCKNLVFKNNAIKYCKDCFLKMSPRGRNRALGLR